MIVRVAGRWRVRVAGRWPVRVAERHDPANLGRRWAAGAALALALTACASPEPAPPARSTPPHASPAPAGTGFLQPASASLRDARRCNDLVETGWNSALCSMSDVRPGGGVAVVGERRAGTGALGEMRVSVYRRTTGGWQLKLRAQGEPDQWARVSSRTLNVGDAQAVAVGYRSAGSGDLLSYDVVLMPSPDAEAVAWHGTDLAHGSVTLATGSITEYAADYSDGAPNCCPTRIRRRVIAWNGTALSPRAPDFIAPSEVPPSDL